MKIRKKAKRIRYKPNGRLNEIESTSLFIGQQGARYVAKINIKELTYRIVNVNTQKILRSTKKDNVRKANSLRYVKDQAKRALKSVGVNFDIEIRNLGI
jgi:hypothetical protein